MFCLYVYQVYLETVVISQSFPSPTPPYFFFLTHSILWWGFFLTIFFPIIPFPLKVVNFWVFWPFSHLRVRALLFPWATVTSLGLRLAEETDQCCPGGDHSRLQNNFLIYVALSPTPGPRTAQLSPCFSHHPQRRFPTVS